MNYTPTAGYSGPDSFQFTVSNGTNTSIPAQVTINVTASSSMVTAVSVGWGSKTAALTVDNGTTLLPSGRTNDIPWLNIRTIAITLSQSAALTAGDVSVTGVNVANYGQVSVSGSGTNYVLTLRSPIGAADRVTITIGNAGIATYTRRLDVLPYDFNDDGVVNSTDMLGIYYATATPYNVFADADGSGGVDINDVQASRTRIGTKLP